MEAIFGGGRVHRYCGGSAGDSLLFVICVLFGGDQREVVSDM